MVQPLVTPFAQPRKSPPPNNLPPTSKKEVIDRTENCAFPYIVEMCIFNSNNLILKSDELNLNQTNYVGSIICGGWPGVVSCEIELCVSIFKHGQFFPPITLANNHKYMNLLGVDIVWKQ